MAAQRELDAELSNLIDGLRAPTEQIWYTDTRQRDTAVVMLIENDRVPQAERMIALGLAGGEGRSLEFKRIDGIWSLVNQAKWVG